MNTETLFAKQASDIAITRLVLQMEAIEEEGSEYDIEQYDIMSQAVSYLATPEQLEELSTREIPTRWGEVILSKGLIHTGDTLA